LDDRCLLFLVKNPEKGAVKTRLARDLGEEVTRDLYRNFIFDMLSTFQRNHFPLSICVYPESALGDVEKLLGENHRYLRQTGKDLGGRMDCCFRQAFSDGFERVVAAGSDIPDLPAEIIGEAFRSLEVVDSVVGPSLDGGYYLIGFHRTSFLREAFCGMQWGTDKVLRQTIEILKRHKRTTHLLPAWQDVDTIEDLKGFLERNKDSSDCPRTITYLQNNEVLPTKHRT
jgi:rSAM/selenodomain-associated transferase 1